MARLERCGWTYSIGVRQRSLRPLSRRSRAGLADPAGLPEGGEAQIAQTSRPPAADVRRPSTAPGRARPTALHAPNERRDELVEAEHRQHAVVELATVTSRTRRWRPAGKPANAADVTPPGAQPLRWTTLIGLPDTTIPTARTLRRRLLNVPGRITRTARQVTLRMPARWPWETQFLTALERLRACQR